MADLLLTATSPVLYLLRCRFLGPVLSLLLEEIESAAVAGLERFLHILLTSSAPLLLTTRTALVDVRFTRLRLVLFGGCMSRRRDGG